MNSLKITRKRGLFVPSVSSIRVRHNFGRVQMLIGDSIIDFNTIQANKAGLDLCNTGWDSKQCGGDIIVFTVNSKAIELPAEQAIQLGAALLRKADDADDYQLNLGKINDR